VAQFPRRLFGHYGNQALIEPMDRSRKLRMFDMLVRIGLADSDALPVVV
jgi:hypothetical protein